MTFATRILRGLKAPIRVVTFMSPGLSRRALIHLALVLLLGLPTASAASINEAREVYRSTREPYYEKLDEVEAALVAGGHEVNETWEPIRPAKDAAFAAIPRLAPTLCGTESVAACTAGEKTDGTIEGERRATDHYVGIVAGQAAREFRGVNVALKDAHPAGERWAFETRSELCRVLSDPLDIGP